MGRTKYTAALVILSAAAAHAQSFRPIRYLGEIGHLDTDRDPRNVVDFGMAKVYPDRADVRFEGKDDRGEPWRAVVAVVGGIGWTDVWRADFDANSRQDLMVAATFPANGRCISPVTITFLMFDSGGSPVPWTIETFLPNAAGQGKMPALLTGFDRNRRAEFIATGCEYSPGPGADEDRSIAGIYEAEGAHWKLIRPANLKPYSEAMRERYSRGKVVHFLPAKTASWNDYGNPTTSYNAPVTITQVLPSDPKCRDIVRLPVIDGRVVLLPNPDPCEILGRNRFEIKGGNVCLGWPTIVQDRASGREIVAAGSSEIESKLREIAASGTPVMVIGQSDPKYCSPTLLWINRPK